MSRELALVDLEGGILGDENDVSVVEPEIGTDKIWKLGVWGGHDDSWIWEYYEGQGRWLWEETKG